MPLKFNRPTALQTPSTYGAKLFALAAIAALLPFVLVVASAAAPLRWSASLLALGASALLLAILWRALAPIDRVADALEKFAERSEIAPKPGASRMLENVDRVATKLQTFSRRVTRHPLTGMALREEFLSQVGRELVDFSNAPRLLGIVRFANYGQISAFDPAAAERTLIGFARRIEQAVDNDRPLAHVDRETFAIWFSGDDNKSAIAELQALSYVLAQEIKDGELTITPDIQIGWALSPLDAIDPAMLLTRAYVALARPQRTATGGVSLSPSPTSATDARQRFALEQDLRQAVRRQQLTLHYQPIVDLEVGRVIGAEALLRWRHNTLGSVSPSEFVPILEQSGLIHEIGLWTLDSACRQARAWREAGHSGLKMAVNLSAVQLRDPSLQNVIMRTLERHDLAPQNLELELTETAAMEDGERTRALFNDLNKLGFGLAIDDFGAGYSSLSYLKSLPFNKLKIDREFVSRLDTRPNSRAICKALIELTAGLKIAVLAEGVEHYQEVEQLRDLGCSVFQGFYFAAPLAPEAFLETITDPTWQALLTSPARRQQDFIRKSAP